MTIATEIIRRRERQIQRALDVETRERAATDGGGGMRKRTL